MNMTSETGPVKQRVEWIDHARGFAIVLVILFHASSLLRFGYEPPEALVVANAALSPYRMPLLAFLSGFLAYLSYRKSRRKFVVGKIRNLVWPYVIWTGIAGVTVAADYSIWDYEFYITYLWYLVYICCYYFISWMLPNVPRILLILTAVSLAAVIPSEINSVRRFFFLWGVFMLGELAHSGRRHFARLIDSSSVFLGLIPVSVVTVQVVAGHAVLYDPLWLASTIGGILVVCGIFKRAQRFSSVAGMRGLAFLGQNSIVFYVSHYIVIYYVVLACKALSVESEYLVYGLAIVVSTLIGSTLALLSRKFTVISMFFSAPRWRSSLAARA